MIKNVKRPNLSKPSPKVHEQWVARVLEYSTQYDERNWPASCVIGPPRVYPRHGDLAGAWAPRGAGREEYIIVEYDTPVLVSEFDIYETFNPGAVCQINAYVDEKWVRIWSTEIDPAFINRADAESRIFNVKIDESNRVVSDRFRINLDCRQSRTWNEIDCVLLKGYLFSRVQACPLDELDEFAADWFQLLETGDHSDLTLIVKRDSSGSSENPRGVRAMDETFSLHRTILFVRCPKLEALFENASVATITSGNPEAFINFLAFIYTSATEVTQSNVFDLIELSREYDVPDLHEYCISKLVSYWLHPGTKEELIDYANQTLDEKLAVACLF